jgi:hypothetical protein
MYRRFLRETARRGRRGLFDDGLDPDIGQQIMVQG